MKTITLEEHENALKEMKLRFRREASLKIQEAEVTGREAGHEELKNFKAKAIAAIQDAKVESFQEGKNAGIQDGANHIRYSLLAEIFLFC